MKSLISFVLACGLLLLAACAGKPVFQDETTLRSLDGQKVRLMPMDQSGIKHDEVFNSYESLYENTANPEYQAIAMQRIADMGLDKVRATLEGDGYDPTKEEGSVASELGVIIKRYEKLLDKFPDHPGKQRVLYQLAWAHELNGDPELTLITLGELLEQYPEVAIRDEIQFRRGETLFGLRQYRQAEQAYNDIVQLGEGGEFYERGLFKHGWSIFKQGDMLRSLDSFVAVLDRYYVPSRDVTGFTRSEQELLDDTLRIISITFAYLENAESIGEFFARYGARSYESKVYRHLAKLYVSQQRMQDAADTYLQYVERYPLQKTSAVFMAKVMDIYQQGRMAAELLEMKSRFVLEYGHDSPFWDIYDEQTLAVLDLSLQKNLQDLSSFYHARAQKTGKPEDYAVAVQWYERFVQWYPGEVQAAHLNFLMAESLLDSGDAQAAALAFEHVAYQYPQHGKSEEAAYAALLAYQEQIKALQGQARLDKRLEMIASSRRFVSFFASDRRAVEVMSTLAEEMMELKNYAAAVAMAAKVVEHQPRPAARLLGINWNIIAQGNFALGHNAEAEAATLKMLNMLPENDKARNDHLERLAAAIYKQAEQAQAEGNHRFAAQHFLRIGQLAPDTSIRVNAEYDAATAYFANQDWELAIPVLQSFVNSYAGHPLHQGAEEKLAILYEKQGDWLKTAGAYEELYKKEADKDKKRLMLWQIAGYYEKAHQSVTAINTYKRYVKAYRKPYADAMEARHRLSDLYKASGKMAERYWWLKQIVKVDKKGPATERSRYLAAMATLELAQVMLEKYSRVALALPLKKSLRKKKNLMQDSIKAYTRASNYGLEAVTTESTYRIAEIYHAFSQAIFASERPKGLSVEELEQYDILLEEQAYPFEEKAIDVHSVNAQRTRSGIYDKWVRKSFSTLASLSPVRYGKTEKSELMNERIQ